MRLRFRIGTDLAFRQNGLTGWDIDNLSFAGITNTPFAGTAFDAGKRGEGPRGQKPTDPGGGCSLASGRSRAPASPTALAVLLIAAAAATLRRARRRRP